MHNSSTNVCWRRVFRRVSEILIYHSLSASDWSLFFFKCYFLYFYFFLSFSCSSPAINCFLLSDQYLNRNLQYTSSHLPLAFNFLTCHASFSLSSSSFSSSPPPWLYIVATLSVSPVSIQPLDWVLRSPRARIGLWILRWRCHLSNQSIFQFPPLLSKSWSFPGIQFNENLLCSFTKFRLNMWLISEYLSSPTLLLHSQNSGWTCSSNSKVIDQMVSYDN